MQNLPKLVPRRVCPSSEASRDQVSIATTCLNALFVPTLFIWLVQDTPWYTQSMLGLNKQYAARTCLSLMMMTSKVASMSMPPHAPRPASITYLRVPTHLYRLQ